MTLTDATPHDDALPRRRPRIRWNAARRSGALAERGRLVKRAWRRTRRPGESLKVFARRVAAKADRTREWLLAKGCRL